MSPTVAVLGPGAVGGALAVPLAIAGTRVICVARPHTAAAISQEGLTLVRAGEELHAEPEVTTELRDPVDVLFVTVKAQALHDALERVVTRNATAVPLLNGLEHPAMLRARFNRVVVGSVGRFEAFREGPARIVQTTPAALITVTRPIEVLSDAGFEVQVREDESALLWEKVARVAPLAAATALTQKTVGELRADLEWLARLQVAVEEACAVAAADGVELDPAAEWRMIDAMPPTLATSTARDVAAGRPSELDAITGAVVRAARRLDVPTPTLDALWEEACRAQSR